MSSKTTKNQEKALRTLEEEVNRAENILHSTTGYKPEKSKLVPYQEWPYEFTGIFLEEDMTANIPFTPESPETMLCSAIHEYLGHGTYCEHTENGRKLVEYKKGLQGIHTEEYAEEAREFSEEVMPHSEGFAVWTEELILNKIGLSSLWNLRARTLHPNEEKGYKLVKSKEQKLGIKGMLRYLGFSRK
jgi:hypothetical protein